MLIIPVIVRQTSLMTSFMASKLFSESPIKVFHLNVVNSGGVLAHFKNSSNCDFAASEVSSFV